MKPFAFLDPETKAPLSRQNSGDGEVLLSDSGTEYPVEGGIHDLTYPRELSAEIEQVRKHCDLRAEDYEKYLPLTFRTHGLDEVVVRNEFIDALELEQDDKVLEVACGTGRDSILIAGRLGDEGELHMADLSRGMLEICRDKVEPVQDNSHFCLLNAAYLPYPGNYFDAVYSFGGLGEFGNIKQSLAEMVRVCKTGGRIVVGDESMPPWLRGSHFSNVLLETNTQFAAEIPWKEMPVEARDFRLRYVINRVFYLIDFTVGEGEPKADFDFPIPGLRGGSYRTRYEGKLEGVSPEAKRMMLEVCSRNNISEHDWLDQVVRESAQAALGKE